MNQKSKIDLLKAYRQSFQGRVIEQQSTFLSDVDQLAAIQLSVLLLRKKVGDIFTTGCPNESRMRPK